MLAAITVLGIVWFVLAGLVIGPARAGRGRLGQADPKQLLCVVRRLSR